MPYNMKNRFLIIGLTGPLGSGCTQTARFLSGYEVYGKTLVELLQEQCSDDKIKGLSNRIVDTYAEMENLKRSMSKRKAKNLGPYWKAMVDDVDDPYINRIERDLQTTHARLKIYLRRREVTNVLQDYLNDQQFEYENITEKERELFGFGPFIYVSLTDIIVKLVFEAFHNVDGEELFEKYFARKASNGKVAPVKMVEALHENFRRRLSVDACVWERIRTANEFVKQRKYQSLIRYESAATASGSCEEGGMCIASYYEYIRMIKDLLKGVKSGAESSGGTEYMHTLSDILQDWGDNIRATGGPFKRLDKKESFEIENVYTLSQEANTLVKFLRFRVRFLDCTFGAFPASRERENIPACFVLECFRNPFEVSFFRSRYAEFYLVSLYAKEDTRRKRVAVFSPHRDRRDQGEGIGSGEIYKLNVRTCVLMSDIALTNDSGIAVGSKQKCFQFFEKLLRYVAIIRSPGCIPPESGEMFMHLAYSMSLMSTCISRKVGAVVVGPKGYIYGAGWNDVSEGQIGCGLRQVADYENLESMELIKGKFPGVFESKKAEGEKYICFKDTLSNALVENQFQKLAEGGSCSEECLEAAEKNIKVKRLEYCRALHAEENALLQMAKVGGLSVRGGSIYTTTFPCELCSKKIYQTGIKTIYFTEPYPESISEKVFLQDGNRKIEIRPFEGVKSNSFYKLYKPLFDRKDYEAIERAMSRRATES